MDLTDATRELITQTPCICRPEQIYEPACPQHGDLSPFIEWLQHHGKEAQRESRTSH